jgi:PAS domain S-box-containing protein
MISSFSFSENHYRALLQVSPQITYLANSHGEIYSFSPKWFEYSDFAVEESSGLRWMGAIHPSLVETFRTQWHLAHRGKQPYHLEALLRNASGQYRWHQFRGIFLNEATGEKWIGVIIDINEHKISEERLAKLTTMSIAMNSVLSPQHCLQIGVDEAASIIGVNEAFATTAYKANCKKSPVFAKHSSGRNIQDGSDTDQNLLDLSVRICRSIKATRLKQEDLEALPEWSSLNQRTPPLRGLLAVPLISRDGQPMGVIQLSDKIEGDFTEKDEVVITQIAQILATALENARLYEELLESDRRKDEFLAVLSHELRSPLNVISGHTALLRMADPLTDDFTDSLTAIERNTSAQTQLVADLLDTSRIITGKFKLDIRFFELLPVVESALDSVRFAAASKRVNLSFEIDPGLTEMNGEPTRIQQVLWNLLSNAVKFTPCGGRVTLRIKNLKSAIEFVVEDTGIGISPEFLPHVFARFVQEDASKTRKHGGLGLGLSIVRHIAELHGGWAWVESEGKGRGSTFTVSIPAHIPIDNYDYNEAAWRIKDKPAEVKNPQTPVLTQHILVIDDQKDAREILKRFLTKAGAKVTCASSAIDGLALIDMTRWDAIVCDIGMPEMNGYDFIRKWRTSEVQTGRHFTPAIALTAYASEQDRFDALEAGFQKHLTKPVNMNELISTINHLATKQTFKETAPLQDPLQVSLDRSHTRPDFGENTHL